MISEQKPKTSANPVLFLFVLQQLLVRISRVKQTMGFNCLVLCFAET